MPPYIIPIFIAHQGCPHRCVFCNQHSITGSGPQSQEVTAEEITALIKTALDRPWNKQRREVQVAFYGGSFTGLPRKRQEELLSAVKPFIEQGQVQHIRLSTRPDYIRANSAEFLRRHGVKIVELGLQSMDQEVLDRANRGHTLKDIQQAFNLLRLGSLQIGAQLMLGLPGETTAGFLNGVRALAAMRPDFVRLYPALVIRGSHLAGRYAAGDYSPLSMNRAIALSAKAKEILEFHKIGIIRMGLQPSAALEKDLLAGPYHPSFGELVLSRILFNRSRKLLSRRTSNKKGTIHLCSADQSIFRGQANCSIKRLLALGLLNGIDFVFAPDQPRQTIRIDTD